MVQDLVDQKRFTLSGSIDYFFNLIFLHIYCVGEYDDFAHQSYGEHMNPRHDQENAKYKERPLAECKFPRHPACYKIQREKQAGYENGRSCEVKVAKVKKKLINLGKNLSTPGFEKPHTVA